VSRERTKNLSYDELIKFRLVDTALSPVGEALVEMELQIRHIEALEKSAIANDNLGRKVYWLNWFVGFLTAISTALTISLWINPDWHGLLSIIKND